MPTSLTRMTITITEDMEPRLECAKKNVFYDRNKSEMIRELVIAGLNAMDEKAAKEKGQDSAS
ncbi:MAG: hypothetical protein RSE36_02975 [Oscillospiraceae bacterium]